MIIVNLIITSGKAKFIRFPEVQKFWKKLVKIWQSYREFKWELFDTQ